MMKWGQKPKVLILWIFKKICKLKLNWLSVLYSSTFLRWQIKLNSTSFYCKYLMKGSHDTVAGSPGSVGHLRWWGHGEPTPIRLAQPFTTTLYRPNAARNPLMSIIVHQTGHSVWTPLPFRAPSSADSTSTWPVSCSCLSDCRSD